MSETIFLSLTCILFSLSARASSARLYLGRCNFSRSRASLFSSDCCYADNHSLLLRIKKAAHAIKRKPLFYIISKYAFSRERKEMRQSRYILKAPVDAYKLFYYSPKARTFHLSLLLPKRIKESVAIKATLVSIKDIFIPFHYL